MKTKRLPTPEFIRRFLIHVLPTGFHRIRHPGFLANGIRRNRIAKIRRVLNAEPDLAQTSDEETSDRNDDPLVHQPCPKCGGAMVIIETFLRGQTPRTRALPWEDAA